MATGKKHATARAGREDGRAASGTPSQGQAVGRVRTYRVVVIKDGIFVGGRQRRRKGLAS
jgi:hypothetical protein